MVLEFRFECLGSRVYYSGLRIYVYALGFLALGLGFTI